jgi:AraC-like DNA-binding protein
MNNRMFTATAEDHVHPLESLTADVVCTVRRAGYYELDASWVLPERVTPYHVLFFITRGQVEFWVAGRRQVIEAGGVSLTPPQMVQRGDAAIAGAEGLSLYVVHFSARLHGLLDAPSLLGLPASAALTDSARGVVADACRGLIAELEDARAGSWLAANAECARIVAALWRDAVDSGAARPRGDVTLNALVRLKPVFDVIQARHAEPIRITELAELAHLHPVYFSSLFRRGTGLSPGQYIAHYRLGKARDLLASTDLSIDEIARRTGHGTASYLSRAFRRAEGVPPGEYRRRIQSASAAEPGP